MKPDEIRLEQTCEAHPEQYDAFHGERLVGYLRLRHGVFRVDCPECGDTTVYRASPKGAAKFEDDEREHYLHEARVAIAAFHAKGGV